MEEDWIFSRADMIAYSNWVARWCECNKYRKLIDGATPYGLGEFVSDERLLAMYLRAQSVQGENQDETID
jgi:hypothetical protein